MGAYHFFTSIPLLWSWETWHGCYQPSEVTASSSVPLTSGPEKCNYRKPKPRTLLFHGLSDYKETLGWCNGKTRQRYFKFEYLIISSLLSALEDTSWALRSVIQIWMKTFSFNSLSLQSRYNFMWTYLTIYDIFITSCENKDCRILTCYNYSPIHLLRVIDYGKTTIKTLLLKSFNKLKLFY